MFIDGEGYEWVECPACGSFVVVNETCVVCGWDKWEEWVGWDRLVAVPEEMTWYWRALEWLDRALGWALQKLGLVEWFQGVQERWDDSLEKMRRRGD